MDALYLRLKFFYLYMVPSMLLNIIIALSSIWLSTSSWIVLVMAITFLRLLADALEIIRGY